MPAPRAAELGHPVRVIELEPIVSPVPSEPPAETPVEEPEREEIEVRR